VSYVPLQLTPLRMMAESHQSARFCSLPGSDLARYEELELAGPRGKTITNSKWNWTGFHFGRLILERQNLEYRFSAESELRCSPSGYDIAAAKQWAKGTKSVQFILAYTADIDWRGSIPQVGHSVGS
jgi:hypothetical protein